jgi:6-phosphofructokinase
MRGSSPGVAILAHSGGPTPVINASLLGTVEEARNQAEIGGLYGARFGISGILKDDFIDLFAQPAELVERVARSPASALGCSRQETSVDDLARVVTIFRARNVRYFFYTGGNGSMGTAHLLQKEAERQGLPLQVVGIPKTIDNDLLVTDHTPGYPSAARFFAHAVRDIGADNASLPNQVEIVEVLGRNAGWLVASTALAKFEPDDPPHLVYIPEVRLPLEKLLADVARVFHRLGRCVVAVCEGQLDENGEPFGADVRAGSRGSLAQNLGQRLALLISSRLQLRARSEKPGLLGRATSAYIWKTDWDEARLCGRAAVQAAIAGASGVMITLQRVEGSQYSVHTSQTPLEKVAFSERPFPKEWIRSDNTDVLPAFRDYATPLIGSVERLAQLAAHPPTWSID